MSQVESPRVVPLEAGAGPENPPCPACDEPLFGWIGEKPGLAGTVRRCESCGLGVVGAPEGPEAALRELDSLGEDGVLRIVDRASFACALGGAGWFGLRRRAGYYFTLESVRRLVAHRDQVVKSRRWLPGESLLATWQTLLNSVTFGHNVALGALRGAPAMRAPEKWQRGIDILASGALGLPALLIAIPIELTACLFRRGAVYELRLELL
ncbi:MAG TPA: hypothetical protein VGV69_06000 [Solirubrobacterales bacterium]|nr:hypothetical protein [Solirubrobacterales bacterium]